LHSHPAGSYKNDVKEGRGIFRYADGDIDLVMCRGGAQEGDGVSWSPDRQVAWRLREIHRTHSSRAIGMRSITRRHLPRAAPSQVAWRLYEGGEQEEISLDAARALTARIGFPVPPPDEQVTSRCTTMHRCDAVCSHRLFTSLVHAQRLVKISLPVGGGQQFDWTVDGAPRTFTAPKGKRRGELHAFSFVVPAPFPLPSVA